MTQATVYAFAGKKGSGKSAASQALVDQGFVDLKFADPLKNMLRALYQTCGLDAETIERKIEGDLKETPCDWLNGNTPRWAMQSLGTEWRNLLSETLWSDIFIKRVNSGKFGDRIVCSDLRFPHEDKALEQIGAYKYLIERPDLVETEGSTHASESHYEKIKVRGKVNNSGTLEMLQQFIEDLVAANEIIRKHGATLVK